MTRGLSKARISVPIVVVVVAFLYIIVFVVYPGIGHDKESAMKASDLSNAKQSAIANIMYMADHDGYGPPPDHWMDALSPYIKNDVIYTSPGLDQNAGEHGYAYLRLLGGIRLEDVTNSNEVPVLFNSSDLSRNVAGGLDLLPDPPRWEGGNNIAFLDGHAKRHETARQFRIELP